MGFLRVFRIIEWALLNINGLAGTVLEYGVCFDSWHVCCLFYLLGCLGKAD